MLALLLLLACTTDTTTVSAECTLEKPSLDLAEAAVGTTVVATTRPLTEPWDTSVMVGSVNAAVVDLARTECEACDDCRTTAECTVCDDCDTCAADCATCVETVSFVVPDAPLGAQAVVLRNVHGMSASAPLTVLAGSEGDSGDSGD